MSLRLQFAVTIINISPYQNNSKSNFIKKTLDSNLNVAFIWCIVCTFESSSAFDNIYKKPVAMEFFVLLLVHLCSVSLSKAKNSLCNHFDIINVDLNELPENHNTSHILPTTIELIEEISFYRDNPCGCGFMQYVELFRSNEMNLMDIRPNFTTFSDFDKCFQNDSAEVLQVL